MENKHYSLREKLLFVVLCLTSIASLFFFFHFKSLAFPEYNIKFAINRQDASAKAKTFLADMGIAQNGYQDVTTFAIDDEAKTYLERKADVDQTAQLAQNDIDLWHFNTRFYKPFEKEEYAVSFLPNGRLSGFNRIIAENKAGASLAQQDAQFLAEQFLAKKLNADLSVWKLIDHDVSKRPNRTDYRFVWEKKLLINTDVSYRQEVSIVGDQIGSYSEFLQVPEAWTRQYEKERSANDLAQIVDEGLAFLLFGLSALLFFILRFRTGDLRLRFGSYVAFATFVIVILAELNSLPLVLASYPTTESWGAFLGELGLSLVMEACLLSLLNFFVVVVGELFYRRAFPKRIALEQLFRKGLFTKEVTTSLLVGSFGGVISFGYVVLFYIAGKGFGFWSPAEVNYNDTFSTIIPWIYPLFIGFSAAVFEEGIFRLFGIPFLIRYVKKPWIAVVITAFIWGFLHSNYPQSPWFARGIEVGIEGLFLGFIFLRFGILASVVSHYTFNALVTSVALASLNGSLLTNILIALLVSFFPLLIACISLIRSMIKGGFVAKQAAWTNEYLSHIKQKMPSIIKEPNNIISSYTSILTKKFVISIGILFVASLIAILSLTPQMDTPIHDNIATRSEAIDQAKKILAAKHLSPDSYHVVASYTSTPPSSLDQDYLTEYADFKTIQNIYPKQIPLALWKVRFYKPLEKEEYHVFLLPSGKFYTVDHLLSEDAQGKNLTEHEASQIAISYLQNQQHEVISAYKVIAAQATKRANRTDYAFTFEKKEQIHDSTIRVSLNILGNEPSGFQKYLKLPQEWVREREKTTTLDFLFDTALLLPSMFLFVYAVTTFFRFLKTKKLYYKQALILTLPLLGISILELVNQSPLFYAHYPTSISVGTYLIEETIGMGISQIVLVLFVSSLIALFIALWKERYGQLLPTALQDRMKYCKDALFIGYLFPILFAGYGVVIVSLSLKYQVFSALFFAEDLSGIDQLVPVITIIDYFSTAMLSLLGTALLILLVRKKMQSLALMVTLIGSLVLLSEGKELFTSSQDTSFILLQLALTIVSFLLLSFVMIRVIKTNLLAYVMIFYTSMLLAGGLDFVSQENAFLQLNGYILFLLGILPLIVYFVKRRTMHR